MNTRLDSSSEFATLVNQLHCSPDDPVLKQAVVSRLPQMKALAQKSPLALYRLAQVYPKSSTQYAEMMSKAADLGCTNAMLAACQFLVKTSRSDDFRKAAYYMLLIDQSADSYIKQNSRSLLDNYPQLSEEMRLLQSSAVVQCASRFFTPSKTTESPEWSETHSYPDLGH